MNIDFEKLFLLENLTNHIPLGLIFISPEKKIDFINKKAKSFLHSKSKSVEMSLLIIPFQKRTIKKMHL